jgi:GT2 family glycosyltransferase
MVRRQLFCELGGFDESFPFAAMEDVDFRERLRDRGEHFEFVPDATVDHPPRYVAGVKELVRQHKSAIYFEIVKRRTHPKLHKVLIFTIKTRVRLCLRPGISDLPRAAWIYGVELCVLTARFRQWCRAYPKA